MLNDFSNAISLTLTSPTIILSFFVLAIWRRDAWESFKKKPKDRLAYDWLILGVFIGFLGGFFDNIYWGIAWSTNHITGTTDNWWFKNGNSFNIFFRQLAGLYAAYCHLQSYYITKNELNNESKNRTFSHLAVSLSIGVLVFILLTMLR